MPAKFPRFRAGETFGLRGPNGTLILDKRTADLFNAAATEMRRLGNVSATAPLRWVEDKSGRLFSVDMPQVILAKLSGAGATYTFVQQQYDKVANTFSDMTGGRTGTVYESTGKTGLAGKVVLIEYQPSTNDWRFQYIGLGCTPGTSFILLTITDNCTGNPVAGASVTLKTTSPITTVGTGTTDGSGQVTFPIDNPGSYFAEVTKANYNNLTISSINATCGATTSKSGVLIRSRGTINFTFTGTCQSPFGGGFPIPGAAVTAKQGATTVATGTTDSSGVAILTGIPTGVSTTITATNSDYSSSTGTVSGVIVSNVCTTVNTSATAPLNANHHCICWSGTSSTGGTCLVGNDLDCSTPWGNTTLTFNPSTGLWEGEIASGSGWLCPAVNCNGGTSALRITYGRITSVSGGCGWGISFDCTTDGVTSTIGGEIPGGGSSGGSDTGTGGCSPFFATTTITLHLPAPWGNLVGIIFWCGSDSTSTYTFSVAEV